MTAAEIAERRLQDHICPACGASDWIARDDGDGRYVLVDCDDCGRYAVRVKVTA